MIRVSGSISSRLGCALLLSAGLASCTNPSTASNLGPVLTHDHTALDVPQAAGQAVTLTANVEDTDGVASVTVFYQVAHASSWQTVSLQPDGVRSAVYTGQIPAAAVVAPSISYYFAATDRKGATATLPVAAPTEAFTFTVTGETGDTEGPVISHVPVANDRVLGTAVQIRATVTDTSGVASVVCHYRAPGAPAWDDLTLVAGSNGTYEANLPNGAVVPPALEYYLEAVDLAATPHTSTLPKNAPNTVFSFTVSPGDDQAPTITHTPVANGQPENRPVPVTATVDDGTGIAAGGVKLYYRVSGTTDWTSLTMTQATSSSPWVQTVPAAAVTTAGVEYYLEAQDSAPMGNVATHPADAPTAFHTFTTAPETCVVPPLARESFEGGILPGWWREYHSGVTGCGWNVSTARAHDGSYGVQHGWSGNCNDILVLPCLDLTNAPAEGLVFDWWQYEESASYAQSHTLEYAFNNPDPAQSTYVAFTPTLPIEQTAGWVHRSVLIPPSSPIMGQAKVYLALRYIGSSADKWTIDEIQIRPPQPVMEFAAIETTPNPIVPSGTAGNDTDVTLTVKLRNVGDRVGPALTGVLSLPTADPKITITTDSGSFPACPAGGETAADQFRLTVEGTHSQTSVALNLHINELNVDIPISLYIGARATARITMTTASATWESDVDLFLGYGADPAQPTWVQSTKLNGDQAATGSWTYDVDLTAQLAHLPPSVTTPWFLQIDHNWDGSCVIDDFTIFYGTNSYKAQGIPFSAPGDETSYIQLPTPPNLNVDAIATTPTTLAPGTAGAALTITLRNDGAATTAAVTGTLAPKDAATAAAVGASLDQTTAHAFGAGPMISGQKIAGAPWTFDVATAFNDGKPLSFVLTLTDGTATWHLDVAVPVPWPGVSVVGWTTNGGTPDFDFLPDPGETVGLTIRVQNTGTLVTAGPVTGTLTWTAGGAAGQVNTATALAFSGVPLGAAAIGTSEAPFEIHVDAGATAHQQILMNLALTDGTNNWARPIVIPLYANLATDPSGDGGSGLDLQAAYYWCDNTDLEVRAATFGTFDAAAGDVSVVVSDLAGKVVRLRLSNGTLSAQTWEAAGWTEMATVPPSLTVAPAAGLTSVVSFKVVLSELGLSLGAKQAGLAVQSDASATGISDSLPDAWNGSDFTKLVTISWP